LNERADPLAAHIVICFSIYKSEASKSELLNSYPIQKPNGPNFLRS